MKIENNETKINECGIFSAMKKRWKFTIQVNLVLKCFQVTTYKNEEEEGGGKIEFISKSIANDILSLNV